MMVRCCGLELRPAGECGSECVCVSIKRKERKMKERNEGAGQKREERWVKMSGGEWG